VTAEKEFAEVVMVEPDAAGGFAMLFTSERDLAECVLPRLEMAGADMKKVIVVPFEDEDGEKSTNCHTLVKVAAKYEQTLKALQAHYRDVPRLAKIPLVRSPTMSGSATNTGWSYGNRRSPSRNLSPTMATTEVSRQTCHPLCIDEAKGGVANRVQSALGVRAPVDDDRRFRQVDVHPRSA
jgi:hypothetical protein